MSVVKSDPKATGLCSRAQRSGARKPPRPLGKRDSDSTGCDYEYAHEHEGRDIRSGSNSIREHAEALDLQPRVVDLQLSDQVLRNNGGQATDNRRYQRS